MLLQSKKERDFIATLAQIPRMHNYAQHSIALLCARHPALHCLSDHVRRRLNFAMRESLNA